MSEARPLLSLNNGYYRQFQATQQKPYFPPDCNTKALCRNEPSLIGRVIVVANQSRRLHHRGYASECKGLCLKVSNFRSAALTGSLTAGKVTISTL